MHVYEDSRSPHASVLHGNPPGFPKKKKVGYFSNRVVFTNLLLISLVDACVFNILDSKYVFV